MITKKEVIELFEECGFDILEYKPIYVSGGFEYDIPSFLKVMGLKRLISPIKNFINTHKTFFGTIFAHHHLIICKKI